MLGGLGLKTVEVNRKPRLGIISVGDELVEFERAGPNEIPNNYGLLISGLASNFGADAKGFGIVPNEPKLIRDKLMEALAEVGIVATVGGFSVERKDFVPDSLNVLGEVLVRGIAISLGHITGAGVIEGKPVIMLLGHAVSCADAFYLFVLPLINKIRGLDPLAVPTLKAKLGSRAEGKSVHNFLRVSLKEEEGSFVAEPVHGGSNILMMLIKANAFTIIPPDVSYDAEDELEFILLDPIEYSHINLS